MDSFILVSVDLEQEVVSSSSDNSARLTQIPPCLFPANGTQNVPDPTFHERVRGGYVEHYPLFLTYTKISVCQVFKTSMGCIKPVIPGQRELIMPLV